MQEIIQLLKVSVHLVPIQPQVFMHKNITKTGNWCKMLCKLSVQNTQLAHPNNGIMCINRLFGSFKRDDAMANIDAALGSDLKVSFSNVAQVGSLIKLPAWFFPDWLQSSQALPEFVQAPVDTFELWLHVRLP